MKLKIYKTHSVFPVPFSIVVNVGHEKETLEVISWNFHDSLNVWCICVCKGRKMKRYKATTKDGKQFHTETTKT